MADKGFEGTIIDGDPVIGSKEVARPLYATNPPEGVPGPPFTPPSTEYPTQDKPFPDEGAPGDVENIPVASLRGSAREERAEAVRKASKDGQFTARHPQVGDSLINVAARDKDR